MVMLCIPFSLAGSFGMLFLTGNPLSMMREMGVVIVGGLVASTILTLFLMQPFYLLIRRENLDGTKKRKLIN